MLLEGTRIHLPSTLLTGYAFVANTTMTKESIDFVGTNPTIETGLWLTFVHFLIKLGYIVREWDESCCTVYHMYQIIITSTVRSVADETSSTFTFIASGNVDASGVAVAYHR